MSVKAFKGDDIQFKLLIKQNNQCYDLTNVTTAVLKIPSSSGTTELNLASGLTIPTPVNGEIVVTIQDSVSSTLNTGKLNLELILEESGDFKTLQFLQGLEMTPRLY